MRPNKQIGLMLLPFGVFGVWLIYMIYVRSERALAAWLLVWMPAAYLVLCVAERSAVAVPGHPEMHLEPADLLFIEYSVIAMCLVAWPAHILFGNLGVIAAVGTGVLMTMAVVLRRVASRARRP
jgi:hypothetical protein